ncbi:ABC transporter ATP-binding protein [Mangrovivirga cuniculi]|uniref:ABC transporter ATP-binding protein n=1 Tax=Mangrovivirga cuniculi TaxID=2715131 RepID=UPI002680F2E6
MGASGAGKSTLLHILGTLDTADSGRVTMQNKEINKLNKKAMARFRNENIGFIFQFHNLMPEFTALENICIPAFINGKKSKQETENAAKELMLKLNLKDRFHHKPSQMSGGEQQRVAVARALINEPKIVFADEPSGNLDSKNAAELHRLFFDLRDEFGRAFVIVTHNNELASMADRCLEMKDGLIV